MQQVITPAVRHRQHTAAVTALDLSIGLHRQAQSTAWLALGREDTNPRHAEHHRCRRAALTTVHLVEALRSVSLVATDL